MRHYGKILVAVCLGLAGSALLLEGMGFAGKAGGLLGRHGRKSRLVEKHPDDRRQDEFVLVGFETEGPLSNRAAGFLREPEEDIIRNSTSTGVRLHDSTGNEGRRRDSALELRGIMECPKKKKGIPFSAACVPVFDLDSQPRTRHYFILSLPMSLVVILASMFAIYHSCLK